MTPREAIQVMSHMSESIYNDEREAYAVLLRTVEQHEAALELSAETELSVNRFSRATARSFRAALTKGNDQ